MTTIKKFPRKPIFVCRSATNPRIIASIWQVRQSLIVSVAKFIWRAELSRYRATNNFFMEELPVVLKVVNQAWDLMEALYEDYPGHIYRNKRVPTFNTVKNQKLRMYLRAHNMIPLDTGVPPQDREINILEVGESINADLSESAPNRYGDKNNLATPEILVEMHRQAQQDYKESDWDDPDEEEPKPQSEPET